MSIKNPFKLIHCTTIYSNIKLTMDEHFRFDGALEPAELLVGSVVVFFVTVHDSDKTDAITN